MFCADELNATGLAWSVFRFLK